MSNFFQFKWLTDFFHSVVDLFHKANKPFIEAAIKLTSVVKSLCDSSITDWAVAATSTNVDNQILEWAKVHVPLILADELAYQNLTPESTPEEVQAFMMQAISTFGKMSDDQKEELWTSIAAKILKQLEAALADKKLTFGEAASLVQTGWDSWQQLHGTQLKLPLQEAAQ